MRKILFAITVALCILSSLSAQERLTREQILAMSTEELSDLPLEDLMQAVETLGVSSVDELFALIMNKNVSSASKNEEDSFVSPLSSTVLTSDEMRTYGVSTIEEALRLIPGMIVSEKTNGVYDVQVRGLYNIPDNNMILYTENANILVMVDGRITHNYATGMPNFETLPISIEDVERIEVVRGATSALYGPNAVNGVVNIIIADGKTLRVTGDSIKKKGDISKRLDDLQMRLDQRQTDMQDILLERIRDKAHEEIYTKMLMTCDEDIERIKQEMYSITHYNATIKKRKAEMKESIDIIEQIIEEGEISDANLRLLVDSIVISEKDKKLHITINLNARFEQHKDCYDEDGNLTERVFTA